MEGTLTGETSEGVTRGMVVVEVVWVLGVLVIVVESGMDGMGVDGTGTDDGEEGGCGTTGDETGVDDEACVVG